MIVDLTGFLPQVSRCGDGFVVELHTSRFQVRDEEQWNLIVSAVREGFARCAR